MSDQTPPPGGSGVPPPPPGGTPPPPQEPGTGWGQPQPGWEQGGQPHWGGPAPGESQTNGLAVAALVCGIIALLLSWIPFINLLTVFLGTAAVITGIMGIRRARPPVGQKGMAVAGLVTGGLGLLVAVAMLVFFVGLFGDERFREEFFEEFEQELERQQELEELEDAT